MTYFNPCVSHLSWRFSKQFVLSASSILCGTEFHRFTTIREIKKKNVFGSPHTARSFILQSRDIKVSFFIMIMGWKLAKRWQRISIHTTCGDDGILPLEGSKVTIPLSYHNTFAHNYQQVLKTFHESHSYRFDSRNKFWIRYVRLLFSVRHACLNHPKSCLTPTISLISHTHTCISFTF